MHILSTKKLKFVSQDNKTHKEFITQGNSMVEDMPDEFKADPYFSDCEKSGWITEVGGLKETPNAPFAEVLPVNMTAQEVLENRNADTEAAEKQIKAIQAAKVEHNVPTGEIKKNVVIPSDKAKEAK